MRNREFGVEIECNFRSQYISEGAQRILAHEILDSLPISEEWKSGSNSIGYDGSGIEVRTPILSGATGFKELRLVMNTFMAKGGRCTVSDGMHVHHNAPDFESDKENCIRLVKTWQANQKLIAGFVTTRRRNNYWACYQDWTNYAIKMLEEYPVEYIPWGSRPGNKVQSPNSRGALNLSSLIGHGSIEFRLHQGTLDYEKAEAWIKFGQAMLNDVIRRKRPLKATTGHPELLKSMRVPVKTQNKLLDTARRNRTFKSSEKKELVTV